MLLAKGTNVGFNSGSRLRQVTPEGKMIEAGMNEGVIIGEQKKGKVLHPVQTPQGPAYVVEVENQWYGWVWGFETHSIDER